MIIQFIYAWYRQADNAGFFSPMAKSICFFQISKKKFPIQGTKERVAPFVTSYRSALCHSKLYSCIPNFKMFLLVTHVFDFFVQFDYIIWCEISQFCTKRREKFSILEARSFSQNGESILLIKQQSLAMIIQPGINVLTLLGQNLFLVDLRDFFFSDLGLGGRKNEKSFEN